VVLGVGQLEQVAEAPGDGGVAADGVTVRAATAAERVGDGAAELGLLGDDDAHGAGRGVGFVLYGTPVGDEVDRQREGGVVDGKSASDGAAMIDVDTFRRISAERLPFAAMMGIEVDSIERDAVRLRVVYAEHLLRPGGTIAGPVMMGLADAALYALVMARIGPVELAVTTQLSINFLRRPAPGDLIAEARMLKLGKRLAVGEVSVWSESDGPGQAVAHATGTYSIPPPESGWRRAG